MSDKNPSILDAKIEQGKISDVYRKIARIYDTWGKFTESKARDRCLELDQIKDGESVLEVAVGTGLAFEQILKSNPSGHNEGIDLTDEMLAKARTKAEELGIKNYNLKIGNAYNPDFPDKRFDLLINNYMFDLLPEADFEKVLLEFNRVLRPGGRLILVNMAKGEHWYNHIWEALYKLKPSLLGGCRGVYLSPYLEKVGFQNIKREFISQYTWPSEVVFANKA